MKAQYFEKTEDEKVKCLLCPHECILQNNKAGICGVRKNINGNLETLIYGEITAIAIDPIEKKPLYHFFPGTEILSVGTRGCNFKCNFCQNWNISQNVKAVTENYDPAVLVKTALEKKSIGIAYTYSEPVIWFEYVMKCSKMAKNNGLKNVMVTNGYINKQPLDELLSVVDAMNIDLKSFNDKTYKNICGSNIDSVLTAIERSVKKCHVELTTLIVTGMNDNIDEMKLMIDWISRINKSIPWHISRYHPSYKCNQPATDIGFMKNVYEEAKSKLDYVYCGNLPGDYGMSNTECPFCKSVIVTRYGYNVEISGLNNNKCAACGNELNFFHN